MQVSDINQIETDFTPRLRPKLTAKSPHDKQSSDDSFLTLQFRPRLKSRKHKSNDSFSDSHHGKLSKRMRASESSENDSTGFSNANNVNETSQVNTESKSKSKLSKIETKAKQQTLLRAKKQNTTVRADENIVKINDTQEVIQKSNTPVRLNVRKLVKQKQKLQIILQQDMVILITVMNMILDLIRMHPKQMVMTRI